MLLFLVAVALLLADHTLGKSLTVHLLVHHSGQLYVGAEVQLAGERIGELTAIRRYRPRPSDPKELQDREPLVEMELRIVRRAGGRLAKNSTFLARIDVAVAGSDRGRSAGRRWETGHATVRRRLSGWNRSAGCR